MMMLLAATSPGSSPAFVSSPPDGPMDPTNWASPAVTFVNGNLRFDTGVDVTASMPLDSLLPDTSYRVDFTVNPISGVGQFQVTANEPGPFASIVYGSSINPGPGAHSFSFTTPSDVSALVLSMSGDPLVMFFSDLRVDPL